MFACKSGTTRCRNKFIACCFMQFTRNTFVSGILNIFLTRTKKIGVPVVVLVMTFSILVSAITLYAAQASSYFDMSLEKLMDIEVTTVSKKPEKMFYEASAVFVITKEDIRRSGKTFLPDILRMVPGIEVGRAGDVQWGVTSRGFNGIFATKLLVLIDGRTVYSPLFSGVDWVAQTIPPEDIERIEVIRGPGSAVWGANAVNGVINIITTSSQDAKGLLAVGETGTSGSKRAMVRFGGSIGEDFTFKLFGQYLRFADIENSQNYQRPYQLMEGIRIEGNLSSQDKLTLIAGASDSYLKSHENHAGYAGEPIMLNYDKHASFSERYILGKWQHTFSEKSDMYFQLFYDVTNIYSDLNNPPASYNTTMKYKTLDFEYVHRYSGFHGHDMVWGFNFRITKDYISPSFSYSADPESRWPKLYSGFFQDEIWIFPEKFSLTLGAKLEYAVYSGTQFQPTARLKYIPASNQVLWASVTKARRTPSRIEQTVRAVLDVIPSGSLFPGSPTAVAEAFGTTGFRAENLVAYELGYRIQPAETLWIDTSIYYNVYDNLSTIETGTPYPYSNYIVFPLTLGNNMKGHTYGLETYIGWEPLPWWKLKSAVSLITMNLKGTGGNDTTSQETENAMPHVQANIRSMMNLPNNLELDVSVYYVDRLKSLRVPAYTDLTIRLAWRPLKQFEVAVIGQNILDSAHPEFTEEYYPTYIREVKRNIIGKLTWAM